MSLHQRATRGLALIAIGMLALGCSAPAPAAAPAAQQAANSKPAPAQVGVSNVRLVEPQKDSDPYRVEATLSPANQSGSAEVTFRMRNPATGVVLEGTGRVDLQPGTAVVVVSEFQAPRAQYQPEVLVTFPGPLIVRPDPRSSV